jgi:hypothetical protein
MRCSSTHQIIETYNFYIKTFACRRDGGFRVFDFWFIAHLSCCGSGVTSIHDCPILHGTPDFNINEGLVEIKFFLRAILFWPRGVQGLSTIFHLPRSLERLLLRIYLRENSTRIPGPLWSHSQFRIRTTRCYSAG